MESEARIMETESRIKEAKKVLRGLQQHYGKPGARIHKNAANDNADRLDALKGICGHCASLRLFFFNRDGKDMVAVHCWKDFSPVNIYSDVNIGWDHSCPGFGERNEKSK